jgi:hypothetical protein
MSGNKDWLPTRLPEQAVVFENVAAKIAGYQTALGLTAPQVAAIQRICAEFDTAYTRTEQSRAATLALVQWRDTIFKGTPQGTVAPDPPVFPTIEMPVGSTIGILAEFRALRDIMLAAPGYTESIGEDLMIVANGSSGPNIPTGDAMPELKLQVGSGYEINIAGPMHGMDAMRVEYQRNNNGSTWSLVGFLTKTPGVVHISPQTPGDPESGRIRARYIHSNDPVGSYSAEYPVTVSA